MVQYKESWADLEAGRLKTGALALPLLSTQFPYLTNKGSGEGNPFCLCHSEIIHGILGFLFFVLSRK